jgi:hypothetical protein
MTKVALIPSENYQAVMDQFGVLHPSIMDKVSETYRGRVFVEGKQVVLTSGYRDTVNSCNSSNYASELLHLYNPQDGEPAEIEPPVPKRFRPAIITYSMAVQQLAPATMVPSQTNTNTCTSISSITEAELDSLYERLKHKISSESGDTPGVSTEDMERLVTQSHAEISQVRSEVQESVKSLTSQVDKLHMDINKQNCVIVGIQREVQATVNDLLTLRRTKHWYMSLLALILEPCVTARLDLQNYVTTLRQQAHHYL